MQLYSYQQQALDLESLDHDQLQQGQTRKDYLDVHAWILKDKSEQDMYVKNR